MNALTVILPILDYAAVAVFGATGALAAARKKHDLVTFAFFAAVTGVGGGTLRDVLLGAPVFWVKRPAYLGSCVLAALAIWLFEAGKEHLRIIAWLDAVGLAPYAVFLVFANDLEGTDSGKMWRVGDCRQDVAYLCSGTALAIACAACSGVARVFGWLSGYRIESSRSSEYIRQLATCTVVNCSLRRASVPAVASSNPQHRS